MLRYLQLLWNYYEFARRSMQSLSTWDCYVIWIMGHCRKFEPDGISIRQCDSIFLLDEGPKTSERSVYSTSITNADIHVHVFQSYMTVCTCVIFSHGTVYANRKHNIQKGSEIHDTLLSWQRSRREQYRKILRSVWCGSNTGKNFIPVFLSLLVDSRTREIW